MKSQKIMLWGWFGFKNLGDDLLLNTMLDILVSDSRIITIPMSTKYDIEIDNLKQINRNYKELFNGAFNNEVLIIGPGGLFPFDNAKKVCIYLMVTLLWKLLGRRVAYFGVGISDRMSFVSRKLWKIIASLSDLFITRSPHVIENLGLSESSKKHTMADTVFASNLSFAEFHDENRVAVFVANLKQPGMEKKYSDTVRTWQKIVSALLDRGLAVDLFAFTKGTDEKLVSDVATTFIKRGGVRTILYEDVLSSVTELKKYRFTISMRFHALVLSLLAEVPTIPIAYGQKTYSLAQDGGLSEYVLIWNSFQKEYYGYTQDMSADEVMKKVDLLLLNYEEVKDNMIQETEVLKSSAKSAMKQLLELINHN